MSSSSRSLLENGRRKRNLFRGTVALDRLVVSQREGRTVSEPAPKGMQTARVKSLDGQDGKATSELEIDEDLKGTPVQRKSLLEVVEFGSMQIQLGKVALAEETSTFLSLEADDGWQMEKRTKKNVSKSEKPTQKGQHSGVGKRKR